uniref:Transcriptional regulator n=1 Tax=Heterorhabditis bacteriophora TaxID=37862 RepID=A0A1I7WQL4_HETBA
MDEGILLFKPLNLYFCAKILSTTAVKLFPSITISKFVSANEECCVLVTDDRATPENGLIV